MLAQVARAADGGGQGAHHHLITILITSSPHHLTTSSYHHLIISSPPHSSPHRLIATILLPPQVREQMGEGPVYLSYDIDSLDPAFAPGTGTLEVGGLTVWQVCSALSRMVWSEKYQRSGNRDTPPRPTTQGLEIIRGCAGLDLVGCDLVEVIIMIIMMS